MLKIALSLLAVVLVCFAYTPKLVSEQPKLHSPIVRLYDVESGRFFCSGAVISEALVVSAAHCMDMHPKGILVKTDEGKDVGTTFEDVRYNERSDLALILGHFPGFEHAKITQDPHAIMDLFANDEVSACGAPYAGPTFCTKMKIKGQYGFGIAGRGNAWPGMSGGPVFDRDSGVIIGVITAMMGEDMIVSPTVNIFYQLGLLEVK